MKLDSLPLTGLLSGSTGWNHTSFNPFFFPRTRTQPPWPQSVTSLTSALTLWISQGLPPDASLRSQPSPFLTCLLCLAHSATGDSLAPPQAVRSESSAVSTWLTASVRFHRWNPSSAQSLAPSYPRFFFQVVNSSCLGRSFRSSLSCLRLTLSGWYIFTSRVLDICVILKKPRWPKLQGEKEAGTWDQMWSTQRLNRDTRNVAVTPFPPNKMRAIPHFHQFWAEQL